jgi:hypothetical protein
MDKVEKYNQILQSLILKYAEFKPRYTANEWQPICDREHGEYLLLKFVSGTNGESRNKYSIFHFRLKNGKVFIEENNTDTDIAGELLDLGIKKQDIVIQSFTAQNNLALA